MAIRGDNAWCCRVVVVHATAHGFLAPTPALIIYHWGVDVMGFKGGLQSVVRAYICMYATSGPAKFLKWGPTIKIMYTGPYPYYMYVYITYVCIYVAAGAKKCMRACTYICMCLREL